MEIVRLYAVERVEEVELEILFVIGVLEPFGAREPGSNHQT
jgi:hypothetical protein